jgi:hypothetical protein
MPEVIIAATPAPDIPTVLIIIFFGGFAIQQVLEIADPVFSLKLPSGPGKEDAKKIWMAILSVIAAGLLVYNLPDNYNDGFLFELLDPKGSSTGWKLWFLNADFLLSVLLLSTGTEASNTILKYFTYVKQVRKPAKPPAYK